MPTATLPKPSDLIPDDPDERAFLPGYDGHGNPDLRFLPGHPWAEADDLCGRLRDALDLTLQHRPIEQIELETGVYPQMQGRLRRHLGLRQAERNDPHLTEAWPGAFSAARQALATIDGCPDLTFGCLRAGLVGTRREGGPALLPRIPVSHPAAVAWRAERAATVDFRRVKEAAA